MTLSPPLTVAKDNRDRQDWEGDACLGVSKIELGTSVLPALFRQSGEESESDGVRGGGTLDFGGSREARWVPPPLPPPETLMSSPRSPPGPGL